LVSIKEKRKVTRTIVDIPIGVKPENNSGQGWHVTTLDISISGLQLRSKQPIEVGSIITLEFPKDWQGLTLVANVVRQSGDCFGCQFLGVKPTDQEVLDKAIWKTNICKLAEQYHGDTEKAFRGLDNHTLDSEKMMRRLEELEQEVAILKQVAGYIAKPSK